MAGLFHPLLCSFCGFTALFPKGTVLLQLLFACLFKELLSFAYFQLLTDNVSYSLGNAGKKKSEGLGRYILFGENHDLQGRIMICREGATVISPAIIAAAARVLPAPNTPLIGLWQMCQLFLAAE